MKKLISIFIVLVMLVGITACASKPYKEEDFIGLTSAEIIEKYGEFDNVQMSPSEDGLYRNCGCGYVVVKAKVGFFGTTPPELFNIYFDENGVAYRCAYETGGAGG